MGVIWEPHPSHALGMHLGLGPANPLVWNFNSSSPVTQAGGLMTLWALPNYLSVFRHFMTLP